MSAPDMTAPHTAIHAERSKSHEEVGDDGVSVCAMLSETTARPAAEAVLVARGATASATATRAKMSRTHAHVLEQRNPAHVHVPATREQAELLARRSPPHSAEPSSWPHMASGVMRLPGEVPKQSATWREVGP